MRLLLLYPPFGDPTYPFPAVPALSSHLRSRGHNDVLASDVNLGLHLQMLTPEFITKVSDRLGDRMKSFETQATLGQEARKEYGRIAQALASAEWTERNIVSMVRTLRSPDFFSYAHYSSARQCLQNVYSLASADHFPASIELGGYRPACSVAESQGLQPAVNALSCSLTGEMIIELAEEVLATSRPEVIGFSVTYRDQVVPSLLVASIAKRRDPDVGIVWGGAYASRLVEVVSDLSDLWTWVDYVVWGDGEYPLEALLDELASDSPRLDRVPNLVWRDTEHGLQRSPDAYQMVPDNLSVPDYSDFDLHAYLIPEPVIALPATRGCYWGRCGFCSLGVTQSAARPFREAKPDTVVQWMTSLNETCGARHFSLAVDAARPEWLRALGETLIASGKSFYWQAQTRAGKDVDCSLLAQLGKAGCRLLTIGLESAVPSVLEAMNKGISPADMDHVLDSAQPSEVAVAVQAMIGYPGEAEDDATETLDYLSARKGSIDFLGLSQFELLRGSPVYARSRECAIQAGQPHADCPARLTYEYEVTDGWHRDAVQLFFVNEAIPLMAAFGAAEYPFLESGTAAHTLVSLANTPKRALTDSIRAHRSQRGGFTKCHAGAVLIKRRPDTKAIRVAWTMSDDGKGRFEMAEPLRREAAYLIYVPELDSTLCFDERLYAFICGIDGKYVVLPKSGSGLDENDRDAALIMYLATKHVVTLEQTDFDVQE